MHKKPTVALKDYVEFHLILEKIYNLFNTPKALEACFQSTEQIGSVKITKICASTKDRKAFCFTKR
jgi:hypothetical protein